MLIDTRLATATTTSTIAASRPQTAESDALKDALDLVAEVGVLVAEMGLDENANWAAASPAVAAAAATLRSAVIDLSFAVCSPQLTDRVDAVGVGVKAPPVVRAREVGFLASRLAAILGHAGVVGDERPSEIATMVRVVAERLEKNARLLREALPLHATVSARGVTSILG